MEKWSEASRDPDLIRAYLAGDAGAFDLLYGRYKQPLYGYLQKLTLGKDADVDDLFQKTWLKAIHNLERYEDREKFSAWLMRIAYHQFIDGYRKVKRRGEEAFDDSLDAVLPAPDSALPDSRIRNRELMEAIESAVAELSPEVRAVFIMRNDDIPFREIAEIQQCSINTCLARIQYALKNLRKSLSLRYSEVAK